MWRPCFLRDPGRHWSELEIKVEAQRLINELKPSKAYIHIPRSDHDYAIAVGLRMLVLRHFVVKEDGLYRASAAEREMLRYYANVIEHFLSDTP